MSWKSARMFQSGLMWRVSGGILLSAALGNSQAPTGTIRGVITDENGKPVPGVSVVINSRPDGSSAAKPFEAIVPVLANGTFSLTGVANGTYSICPVPPSANLLPPCTWVTEPRAKIANGNAVTVPRIIFPAAVDLYVRVNDPRGVRAAAEGKQPGATLMLTVRSPNGRILPIPATARDAGGADHHLAVPAETDFEFLAMSKVFALANGLGLPAQAQNGINGITVAINIPKGQAQHRETVNIP
jgi:hypothetical protein